VSAPLWRLHVESYLAVREAMGQSVRPKRKLLDEFLAFVAERQPSGGGPIRAEWALDWACLLSRRRGVNGRAGRLSIVRGFLSYLRVFLPETEVPAHGLLSGPPRPKPYLFSAEEIRRMLAAALELGPRNSLRPHTYHALLGLLASTGLRVGEAIRLTVADVQLAFSPPHLIIRQTKFAKSRLVPVHATTAEQLGRYATRRQRLGYDGLSDAWLISEQGKPLCYSNLQIWFSRLLHRLDIRAPEGKRRPSLHSFRHGFAVERLKAWQEAGADVQALVPHLAVYLGHVSPRETYWYLSATPELLNAAGRSFATFSQAGKAHDE
jgi:integrase/recombinase XerD